MGKGRGSLADFYIDNGLDPGDPNHMDTFFAMQEGFPDDPDDYNDPSYYDDDVTKIRYF